MSADGPTQLPEQQPDHPDTGLGDAAGDPGLPPQTDRAAEQAALSDGQAPPNKTRPDLFFITLVVLALLKAELSRAMGIGSADALLTVALESAGIVFVLGVVDLVWPRRSYALDLVAYTVLSMVMLANVMYVSFMGQIFSPSLLSVVGQAGEVGSAIQALIKPAYALYLIDIPFLIAWAVWSRRARQARPPGRSRLVGLATGIAAIVLIVQVVMVLSIGADVDGGAIARVRGFGPYQIASVARLALPDPSARTVAAFEHPKGVTSPGRAAQLQIDAVRHGDTGPRIGDVKTGQYRGKNVILIQVEALQAFVIGKSYQGQQITPNLNQLVSQSWYFPNTYSEVSAGNTVDAEFTANTSLLAPVDGAASVEYADKVLPGLPRLLREQEGYDAITLHQNDVRFWNRKELYPALGFRRYWDRSYFQNRDKMWHASDGILFSMGMKVLKSEEASTAPFYAAFVTESSHTPFVAVPPKRYAIKLSAADGKTLSGKYIGSISYTDSAIGSFIADLKQSGLWNDSIIVIYGDHSSVMDGGTQPGDSRIADQLLGRPYSFVDHQRIPLIVHLPGQISADVETKTVGQVDIMPTIADLVGLDVSSTPHVGRSVFVDAPALVPTRSYLPSGSFIDDSVLFMPGLSFDDGSAVSVATGAKVTPTDRERQDLARVQQLDLLSDAWIKSLPERPDAHGTAGAIIPGDPNGSK